MEEIKDYKLLLDTAMLAGEIMLSNGGEIYRVEDTILHILKLSGLKTTQSYVTATGIIVTLDDPAVDSLTIVRRIQERDMNLYKITETNRISRGLCQGELTLKEAFRELKHMKAHQYPWWLRDLCNVGVAGFFAVLFGGGWQDMIGAAIAGFFLVVVMHLCQAVHLNAFMKILLESTALALTALLLTGIPGNPMKMDLIIIGGIMPIVPGAAITTAVRDTLQGDYVAGGAKALEALVKVAGIVVGVGLAILICRGFGV